MRLSALLAPDANFSEKDLPLGVQEPTHRLPAPCAFTHGQDAVEFADYCGYSLFDFQKQGLIDKLGVKYVELRDGRTVERWAARETVDIISRRNGKSVEIEVLILVGLFLLGEKKIMYTAHRDDTADEVFNNVVAAIQRTPKLWAELVDKGPRRANGQRSITLRSGAICKFRTRTKQSARGTGYDRLIIDEVQELDDQEYEALSPLVTGSPNAQLNYAGSAGGLRSVIAAKLWRQYLAKESGLCYRGWHADPDADFDDLDLVARTNPRLGHGLSYEFIASEFRKMTRAGFGRERVGVPTYPREEGEAWVIPEEAWERAKDLQSQVADGNGVQIVLEADPDLDKGTISIAGRRADGAMHIEVVLHDDGVAWMLERTKTLQDSWGATAWVDPKGPLGFMLGDLDEDGIKYRTFEPEDLKNAWTWLYTSANPKPDPRDPQRVLPDPTVRHRGGVLMTQALAAAELRKLLERHTLRRQVSLEVNQGPIVGPMLAGYAVIKTERERPPAPAPMPRRVSKRTAPERVSPERRKAAAAKDIRTAGF